MRLKWQLVSVLSNLVPILTPDRCTVCFECNIGSEIVLDAAKGTPRWVMWNLTSFFLEIVLVSVQDRSTVCAKRTIGIEIVWDAPDGTSR